MNQTTVFSPFPFKKGQILSGEEPFPLLLDKRLFVCANISGFKTNDLFLVDALQQNFVFKNEIVNMYINERNFIEKIKFLKENVFPKIPPKYSLISSSLNNDLKQMILIHSFLLDGFSKILKKRPINAKSIINLITHACNVIPVHESYVFNYISIESIVSSFSWENPDLTMEGCTLISIFKTPFNWIENVSSFARLFAYQMIQEDDLTSSANLEEFATLCDHILESADSIPLLEKIAKNFLIEPFPIVQPGRRIIKKGFCMKHCRKDVTERALVLFSDFLVYAQNKAGKWVVPSAYPLSEMKVENPIADIPCIYIYTPRKSFVLEFSSHEENREWFSKINSAIANERASSGISIDSIPFAPIWQPDKTTQVCTICKQEHTFFVRRHHCRSCGCVACSNCLRFRAVVKGVSNYPVKVCEKCYNKIQKQKNI